MGSVPLKLFFLTSKDSWKPNQIINVNHPLSDSESAITAEGWRRKERFNYETKRGGRGKRTQLQTCLRFSLSPFRSVICQSVLKVFSTQERESELFKKINIRLRKTQVIVLSKKKVWYKQDQKTFKCRIYACIMRIWFS